MLVSLHLPKTAGTSFFSSLEGHYGKGAIYRDYGDFPLNTPVFSRKSRALKGCIANALSLTPRPRCIHGHFLPIKYRLCRDAQFVTWMRDPAERLASHYFYWQRTYDAANAKLLHKKMIEENWSLEKFCLSPELRNVYSQFLWGMPIRRFDFIGITEFYSSEMKYFSTKFLGKEYGPFQEKVNPNKGAEKYIQDQDLIKKIAAYHQKDMALYHHALKVREANRL